MMQALAGTMALTGGPDDPPTKYGISVVDHAAGVFAAFAVVAALHSRQHRPTHEVISIDLSLFDTHLSMFTYLACDYLNFGDVPQRLSESAHHSLVPAQMFPTLDGYLVVMVLANRFWPALCRAIDRPDLTNDVRFADPDSRRANREVLIEDLKATFRTRSTAVWVSTLTVHDVPNAPVQTMAEAFAMEQVAAREMVVDLEHHGYGRYRSVGNPIKFEGLRLPMEPAPTLGEHTEDVVGIDETGNLGSINQDSTDVPVFDVDLAARFDDGVLVITLDRPEKANALTRPMIDGLARAIRWAEAEDSIRVVIITGAGDRVFCAGFDVAALTSPGSADSGVERDLVDDLAGIVASSSIPVVAAVNGAAVGAGCDLAVACDSRIAAVNASFAMPPSRIGIMYGWRGMARLLSAVGRSVATDLLLTGDSLTADRAQTLGLVSQVVPQETLLQTAFAKARRLADNAPLSIRATKASIGLLADRPLDQDTQRELDRFQQMVWDSQDAIEGTRAARDRRQPRFEGR
jgi:enoyl-CoA hydratase/carnithine racemase